ncbi:MAG: 30S ribosomal protein S1 [Defluviitaleaceae bacterium]|nr:30S ribosomal protein S1 [Defluviitaleaceae bacterium]
MSENEKNERNENVEIEEVVEIAADVTETQETESFEEMLNESILSLHTGDIVKGAVISIVNGEVMVNLGYKSDGIIQRGHFSDNPDVDPAEILAAGDEIEVYVLRVNDGEGNVLLSKKRIDAQKGQLEIEKAFKNGTALCGKITEVIKGGVIAMINGIRVFVPSSQVSNRFIRDLDSVLGKEFNFHILEFNREKRRIVAGRKELASTEETLKRETAMAGLEEGKEVVGKISRITNFGAFVGLGGIDGLIHISELSWGRIRKVEEVVKEGDEVTARVINLDRENGRVSLSLKDVNDDPWNNIELRYPIGAITTGRVVRLADFGAFIELEEGIDGLVHISQISHKRIERPDEALKIGDVVEVKITGANSERKRISLSIKETQGMITDIAYTDEDYQDVDEEYDDSNFEEEYETYDIDDDNDETNGQDEE